MVRVIKSPGIYINSRSHCRRNTFMICNSLFSDLYAVGSQMLSNRSKCLHLNRRISHLVVDCTYACNNGSNGYCYTYYTYCTMGVSSLCSNSLFPLLRLALWSLCWNCLLNVFLSCVSIFEFLVHIIVNNHSRKLVDDKSILLFSTKQSFGYFSSRKALSPRQELHWFASFLWNKNAAKPFNTILLLNSLWKILAEL